VPVGNQESCDAELVPSRDRISGIFDAGPCVGVIEMDDREFQNGGTDSAQSGEGDQRQSSPSGVLGQGIQEGGRDMLGGGLVNDLRRDGYTRLAYMSSDKMSEVYDFLLQKNVYNAHVQAKASKSLTVPQAFGQRDWPMYCHAMEDAVLAPHFFERALTTY